MNSNLKNPNKKHIGNTIMLVIVIVLTIFLITITYIKIFQKELAPMKLSYIKKEKTEVQFMDGTKKEEARVFINDFGLDINYKLVNKGYSFEIKNNVINIDAKDGSYIYRAIQLDDKPFASIISDELYDEYSDVLDVVYEKYETYDDDNSRKEMQAFYKKHNINRLEHIQTLTFKERLEFINKMFNLNLKEFDFDNWYCNFSDCTSLATIDEGTKAVRISLYTREKDEDDDDKKYYGTFLIYEKYNASERLDDLVEFSSDFFME